VQRIDRTHAAIVEIAARAHRLAMRVPSSRALRFAGAAALAAVPILAVPVAQSEEPTPAPAPGSSPQRPLEEERARGEEIEEMRVTGIRTGRFLDAPSAATTHIDLTRYQGESKTLDDLLGELAGIQIRRFGGAGEPAAISIRGSSAQQVEVTLNGLRLNSPLTGGVDVSELCLGLVDGVSVTRGGRSAIGGRVDLSSPVSTGSLEVSARGSVGSFSTWRGEAHYSDTLGAHEAEPTTTGVDLALGYCGFKTDGDYAFQRPVQDNGDQVVSYDPASVDRINNDRQKHSGHFGLGVPIGERHRLELRNDTVWKRGGVPGLDSGSGALAGQDEDARLDQLFNLAHLEWRSVDFGFVGDEASLGAYYRYQDDAFDDPALPGSVVPDAHIDTRMHTGGVRSLQRWERDGLGGTHALGLSFDASRDAVYSSDRDDHGRTNVEGDVSISSAFFEERFVVSPGFRAAWSQGFDPAFLPSLGLVVTPLPWLRVKANGFASWRVPSFEELYFPDRGFIRGNPDLEAEHAWGADGGIDLVFEQLGPVTSLAFSIGAFYQSRDDEIVWTQVSPWVVAPINLSDTRFVGLELSLQTEITRWVGLSASYTELDGELVSTGQPVPGRAERESHVRVRVGPAEVWKLVGEYQYTGRIPVSQGGNVFLAPRHIGNLSASADLTRALPAGLDRTAESLWIFFAVENVGDVAVRDALFSPQPGRTLTLGLEAHW